MHPVITREFIEARISITASGCWRWLGKISPEGYARQGKAYVHRASYELYRAPIPKGLQIDHVCRNRPCVNPAHLEPVTSRENTMRGSSHIAKRATQTHCIHGHEFTEENTYYRPDTGTRQCRRCMYEHECKRKARPVKAVPAYRKHRKAKIEPLFRAGDEA